VLAYIKERHAIKAKSHPFIYKYTTNIQIKSY